jgi:hypothetical protein
MGDETTIKLEVNWDMWNAIENHGDPVVALDQRTQEELRMRGYDESELFFIVTDPVYQSSVRDEYQACRAQVRDGKYPKRVTIHFTKPGTRDNRGRKAETPAEEPE